MNGNMTSIGQALRHSLHIQIETRTNHSSRRAQEKSFNEFPNYKIPVGEFDVHFIALFSDLPDATPIVLLHGWPGSFIEFLGILKLLTERYSPSTLPYHVIVPSLPGWGFSSKPPLDKDFRCDELADVINGLMVNLGFGSGYVAQGGDIGSFVSRKIAATHRECKAVHCMFSNSNLDFTNKASSKLQSDARARRHRCK